MKYKAVFIICISLFVFFCGCTQANVESASDVSAVLSETPDITLEQPSRPEAIQTILDFTKTEPEEFDEDVVKNIDYYTDVVQEMYDLSYWKAYGVASLALGISPDISEKSVVYYIDRGEKKGFESLFEGFFLERYSDEETIEYAKAYAYYLTKYAIEAHSFSEFAEENFREEWLKSAGSKSEYGYDPADALLDKSKCRYEDKVYSFYVGDNEWVCGNETWVEDASELSKVIHDAETNFEHIRQAMKDDAPVWYENLGKNHLNVKIILYDDENRSYTDTARGARNIYLRDGNDASHEYVHALTLGPNLPWFDGWISEGLAVHYSLEYQVEGLELFDVYNEIMNAPSVKEYLLEHDADTDEFWVDYFSDLKDIYLKFKTTYGDRYSDKLYCAAAMGQKELEDGQALPGLSIAELAGKPGSVEYYSYASTHLSYYGVGAGTDLLIKESGADKILTFLYVAGDFPTEFGFTQQEFLEKVKEEGTYADAFI